MKKLLLFLLTLFALSPVVMAESHYKPFVLASHAEGQAATALETTKSKLAEAGFEVVGEHSPYEGTHLIIVTSEALKSAAAQSEHGAFGAAQRIALVQDGAKVQISYTNPTYMSHVYRMKSDLAEVSAAMAQALGKIEEYGVEEAKSADDLREYHYKMMMPYFDDYDEIAEFASQEEAIAAVERGMAARAGGVSKVYRVDLASKAESLFGVSFNADDVSNDKFIMSEIDFKDIKSAAHLPYDFIVTGGKVIALSAKFRIAINFPDLSMMGDNSFMNIMDAPGDIENALTAITTAK